jgi:hypothetical protein
LNFLPDAFLPEDDLSTPVENWFFLTFGEGPA